MIILLTYHNIRKREGGKIGAKKDSGGGGAEKCKVVKKLLLSPLTIRH